ncbi:hypothetical protein WJX81_002207 [Elliptochloris bilobata]|uniref:Uncharacterized protein n=1 Tax=Elliptochloris bilobata TaxID=381761 RepID=A0AAW1RN57_9CHLO
MSTQASSRWQVGAASTNGSEVEGNKEDLEAAMEDFLRKQTERESGTLVAVPAQLVDRVVGEEQVSDEDAKRYCREVRERREYLGVEDDSGASRDEVAAALLEVAAGRVPKDRIALRELYREMIAWPFVVDAEQAAAAAAAGGSKRSPYEAVTQTGAAPSPDPGPPSPAPGWRAAQARPRPMGRDRTEKPQSFADSLPDWVGYGFLYLVSIVPVLIAGTVVAILFFNSLR